jgi:hypothetical protein
LFLREPFAYLLNCVFVHFVQFRVKSAPIIVSPFKVRIRDFVSLWKHLLLSKKTVLDAVEKSSVKPFEKSAWSVCLKNYSLKSLEFLMEAWFIIFYRFDEAKKTNSCEIGPAFVLTCALASRTVCEWSRWKSKLLCWKTVWKSEVNPWELLKKAYVGQNHPFLNFEKLQTHLESSSGGL